MTTKIILAGFLLVAAAQSALNIAGVDVPTIQQHMPWVGAR